MYIFKCIILVHCVNFLKGDDQAQVDYYTNLITEGQQKASVGEGPKDASEYRPTSNNVNEFGKRYDYIIIGAGAAGAVVASRLSENPNIKVLLIEAGGQENNFTDVPAMDYDIINTPYTWNMYTVPQTNACLGMVNNQCGYPRGRGLGGSTIINNLYYVRANKRDFDNWAVDNPGWAFDDNILPLFLKSENASFNFTDPKYHRRGGLLNVRYNKPLSREYQACIEANLEKGRKHIQDYNGAEQIGVSQVQYNTIVGRRVSTNKAFLRPAYERNNLKIMTWSYAVKININKFTKSAYGVTFSHKKKLYLARAKKEVILSAGVFQSPQLLMLSGVGPPDQLLSHGIPVIQPLDVGKNLQDHKGYTALLFNSNFTVPLQSLEQQVREYLKGYGYLTFGINSQAISWFQTKLEKTPNYPDIEAILIHSKTPQEKIKKFYNFNNETSDTVFSGVNPASSFSITVALMRPKSKGTVKLQSADPYVFPLIDPKLNSDSTNQIDIDVLYEGVQLLLGIVNTTAFKKINATLDPAATHPQCKNHEFNTKDYWFCQFKYLVLPFFHPVGTCKMGSDPYFGGAVVNNKFQVHGIKRLRVVDGSIMPTTVTGHPAAPIIMFGEKVAELILNDDSQNSIVNLKL